MVDELSPGRPAEVCQLSLEIEQTKRLLKIWEAQAQNHDGTGFGEAVKSIATGYVSKLENLRLALAEQLAAGTPR